MDNQDDKDNSSLTKNEDEFLNVSDNEEPSEINEEETTEQNEILTNENTNEAPTEDKEKFNDEEENIDPKFKAILIAAERNEIETVRRLLEEDPNLVKVVDKDQYTPLHRACYSNHSEVVKVLLSCGANVSAKTNDGWEPLHCAAQWDSVEAASLLLHHSANVNAVTKGNLTPLHLAASKPNSRRTLELLLWHPYVDGNVKNEAGDLPYDLARRFGPHTNLFAIIDECINIY